MRIGDMAVINAGNTVSDTVTPAVAGGARDDDKVVIQGEFKLNNEKQRLDEAVQHANKALEGSGRYFKYEVHKPTKQVVISVMDEKTNEVVREIPAKKLLDIVAKFMELAGLVFDERR